MKTLLALLALLLLALPVRACPPALLGAYNTYFGGYGGYAGGYGMGYGVGLDYGVDAYAAAPIMDYGLAYAPTAFNGVYTTPYSAFNVYAPFSTYGVGFNRFGYGFNRFGFNRGVSVRVGHRGFFGRRTVVRVR